MAARQRRSTPGPDGPLAEIWLGDLARAIAALAPRDERTMGLIAASLGLSLVPVTRGDPDLAALKPPEPWLEAERDIKSGSQVTKPERTDATGGETALPLLAPSGSEP